MYIHVNMYDRTCIYMHYDIAREHWVIVEESCLREYLYLYRDNEYIYSLLHSECHFCNLKAESIV